MAILQSFPNARATNKSDELADFANFDIKLVAMATYIERSVTEDQIRNLRSNNY